MSSDPASDDVSSPDLPSAAASLFGGRLWPLPWLPWPATGMATFAGVGQTRAVSVDFIKSRVVASILGFFFCMWYAAMKYCLANNVLGISFRIQGIEMLSLRSLRTGGTLKLLFPIADATWCSSMLTIGDTVIPGIFVALALRIAVPRGSKNRFFNWTFLRYTVGLTVIMIIADWFEAAQRGQPALIGFVAIHCLWDGEVKQDVINQLMGKVWGWNMCGTKLKKSNRWVLHTANEDADRGNNDATPLLDGGDGPKDGSSGPEPLEDSDDESIPFCQRAVQVLAIRANFPIVVINGYDSQRCQRIYVLFEGVVQEEGMVDLVPVGPSGIFVADGIFELEAHYFTTTADDEGPISGIGTIVDGWNVSKVDDTKEYTKTLCAGPDRKLEVTFMVIPDAVVIEFDVRLKLKNIGSRSRAVYGKIKANVTDFGNKSVHLFRREQWRSFSFPSGCTSILLPLSAPGIAVPYRRHLILHMEVDLTVITTCDSQEEEEKKLRFSLEFTRGISSLEKEVDGDGVEVDIHCYPEV
ncbi:hypothetical protein ACP70R_039244 [Stipagrostis hirtigluma subsp. patula]